PKMLLMATATGAASGQEEVPADGKERIEGKQRGRAAVVRATGSVAMARMLHVGQLPATEKRVLRARCPRKGTLRPAGCTHCKVINAGTRFRSVARAAVA